MRLTVAGETPVSATICLPVQRWRRRASTCAMIGSGVGRFSLCGRDDRSCSPAAPSVLKRRHHLRAVDQPHQPLSTERRQTGILVDVHPVLRRD